MKEFLDGSSILLGIPCIYTGSMNLYHFLQINFDVWFIVCLFACYYLIKMGIEYCQPNIFVSMILFYLFSGVTWS